MTPRRLALVFTAATLALAGPLAEQTPSAQRGQPGGQIVPRPAEGRGPQLPVPSITDYKPESTLVVPEHTVPRAKFPVVDIHGHPPALTSTAAIERVVAAMDPLNLRILINASGASGAQLERQIDAIRAAGQSERLVVFTNLQFREPVGPGWGAKAAAQIEADVKAGARGLGEVMKTLGLTARKTDGARLHIDDPELDEVWEACARLGIPAFIHTADPAEFFEPLDFTNERWLEQAIYPGRRYQDRSRFPAFDELMAERDRMLDRHPNTTFVLAHLSWYANDLAKLGRIFDTHPNVYAEVGAILYDLGRQPRTARAFFIKYQDRLLFGKDSFQPDEYPYYWRVFETADEYFDYYRDYHAFWKLYGMDLPDEVLRKLYAANAMRIVPGLSSLMP